MKVPRWLLDLSLVPRCVVAGALIAGVLGGAAGLVIGLGVHAPTAWFAVIELGVPAALVGALLGLAASSAVVLVRALRR